MTWEREFKTTLKVLKAYPANKLDFKPHERSMSAKKLAWSFPTEEGSGVILTLSTPGSRMSGVGFLGYGVTCGAIETFSRSLRRLGSRQRDDRRHRQPDLWPAGGLTEDA